MRFSSPSYLFFKLIIILSIAGFSSSCKNSEKLEQAKKKNEMLTFLNNEEKQAKFFSEMSKTAQSIIIQCSQSALGDTIQKNKLIADLVSDHEEDLLKDLQLLSNKKMLIIPHYVSNSHCDQIGSFSENHLSEPALKENLKKQILLFKNMSINSSDSLTFKFAQNYLPKLQQLLEETERNFNR